MISFSISIILFSLAIPDIKKKKIPVWLLVAAGVTAVVLRIILSYLEITEASLLWSFMALIPGCFFLLLSFATKEQVGYGDGIVLFIIGILCPFWRLMMILGIALSITSFVSIFLLIVRKGNRHTRLPFVPFLWIGAIIEWILEMN